MKDDFGSRADDFGNGTADSGSRTGGFGVTLFVSQVRENQSMKPL